MDVLVPASNIADRPLVGLGTRQISDLDYMNPEESEKMRKDYLNAKRRLIIIGKDKGVLKPSNGANPNEDQKQLEEALRTLAQDRKNEIWMVTSQGVGAAEYAYSHINPNLNFAGRYRNQIQLSKYNTKSVKLPHVGSLLEIENIAKQRITTFDLPGKKIQSFPLEIELSFQYFIPDSMGDFAKFMATEIKDKLETVIKENQKFKDYVVTIAQVKNCSPGDGLKINEEGFTEDDFIKFMRHGFKVQINHIYYNDQRILVEAIFNKDQGRKFDFALSLGGDPVDELTHQMIKSMMSKQNYAILVKNKESEGDLLGTYASHRLEDHKEVINLLGDLAAVRSSNLCLEHLYQFFCKMKKKKT
ncbi:hypothetical protein PCANC_24949, partial [Puccinia coronata f. sp. avenae]